MNREERPAGAHDRPIGFWIKAADKVLDQTIDRLHVEEGFTRRRWQIFNTIAQYGSISITGLSSGLSAMLASEDVQLELDALTEQGVLNRLGDVLSISRNGLEVHHRLVASQEALRKKAMRGISDEDYRAALRCLSTIVGNLEAGGLTPA